MNKGYVRVGKGTEFFNLEDYRNNGIVIGGGGT
jgi:hypothetical protein